MGPIITSFWPINATLSIDMKVAIQGQVDSFHHLAAERWFGDEQLELICCDSFSEVFASLSQGKADYAVCAIENSLHGSINEVYDYNLLLRHQVTIVGEIPERIHQQLIGFAGTDLSSIERLYSHPVALSQCAESIGQHLPQVERIEQPDTAGSLELVRQNGRSAAAIAGKRAAKNYGLSVLQSSIEDEQSNFTRFLVLAKSGTKAPAKANKASLVLQTAHRPGALYHALGVFADKGVNLTKLQSRPIRGQVWRYQFFIDAELEPEQLSEVVDKLQAQDCSVIVLGNYQKAAHTTDES